MADHILVLTTVPKEEDGQAIALSLVSKRLAACITVLPKSHSFYWWAGKVTEDEECVLLIKTRRDLFAELDQEIRALHPYTVPEVISLPIDLGSAGYLAWLDQETKKD